MNLIRFYITRDIYILTPFVSICISSRKLRDRINVTENRRDPKQKISLIQPAPRTRTFSRRCRVDGFYSSHGSIVVNGGLIVDKGATHTDRSMVIFPYM